MMRHGLLGAMFILAASAPVPAAPDCAPEAPRPDPPMRGRSNRGCDSQGFGPIRGTRYTGKSRKQKPRTTEQQARAAAAEEKRLRKQAAWDEMRAEAGDSTEKA